MPLRLRGATQQNAAHSRTKRQARCSTCSPPLRLGFRLRLSYTLNHFPKKASEASQQADNLAKLWCGVLSLCEMIAQIIGAVEKQKPIVAFGIVQLCNSVATLTAFAPAR